MTRSAKVEACSPSCGSGPALRLGWGARAPAVAFACALAVMAPASPVAAAPSSTIPNNRYTLDMFPGPVLAPLRVTGIAGAYAGYAEGIEGMVANAAAPAVREPFSANWLEGDLAASISLPITLLKNDDFDNSGQRDFDYSTFVYLTAGAVVQAGAFGLGASGELKRYTLTGSDQAVEHVLVGKYHLLGGVRVIGDELTLGAGARIVTLGIDSTPAGGGGQTSFTIAGLAPEVGFLVRPDWQSFRLGGTFRFPVDAGALTGARTVDAKGVERLGGLVVPDSVVLPWELELGLAVQVGPRPLNPRWDDPRDQEAALLETIHARRKKRDEANQVELAAIEDVAARNARAAALRAEDARLDELEVEELRRAKKVLTNERRARYWNWPREHLLVTAELLVTGAVENGVSLLRFLGQNQPESAGLPSVIGTSGRTVNFSPRFGIETEPIPTWVHTRFGSYYEPKRFETVPMPGGNTQEKATVGRQHFTFGADLRMFKTTWFGLVPAVNYKLQAAIDVAPRYQSASLGIGVWH